MTRCDEADDPDRRRRARRPRRRSAACCATKATSVEAVDERRGVPRARRRAARSTSSCSTSGCPGMDGLATLARLRERQVDAQVVLISGHGNIESAVRAIKMGAFDFVEKPLSLEKTVLVVRNALRQRRLEAENRALRARVDRQLRRWSARATRCAQLREQVAMAAPTNGRVLIYGENGTGKELVARTIHALSRRRHGAVRRGQLRGDSRGADRERAVRPRARRVHRRGRRSARQVRGGRRRHDLPRRDRRHEPEDAGQGAARAAGAGRWSRSAARSAIQVDVRVLAATNKDLPAEIRAGQFREDLYFRLNVIPIFVPPLRDAPGRHPAARRSLHGGRSRASTAAGRRRFDAGARSPCCSATRGRATCASCAT